MSYKSNADEKIRKIEQNVQDFLELATSQLQGTAQQRAPVDLGHLKQSIQKTVQVGGFVGIGRVFTNAKHAVFHEYGTGIYATMGSSASKIPWAVLGNRGWFTTYGVQPSNFMKRAWEDEQVFIQQLARRILDI